MYLEGEKVSILSDNTNANVPELLEPATQLPLKKCDLSESEWLAIDPHAASLLKVAQLRGIPTDCMIADGTPNAPLKSWSKLEINQTLKPWLKLEINQTQFLYRQGMLLKVSTDNTLKHINGLAASITSRKSLTKSFLQALSVSNPFGVCFGRHEARLAEAWFHTWQQPVCLKPERGQEGILVYPYIDRISHFRQVFELIASQYSEIIVEESFPGDVYRYYYVVPRVVAVKLSRPASVKGDGIQNLESLIAAKNQAREERQVPGHKPIQINPSMHLCLSRQGRDLSYVPRKDERCYVQFVSNGAMGADSIAAEVHPSYTRIIEKACQGLPEFQLGAVDVILKHPDQVATPANYRVLEMNSSAGVAPFQYLWEGSGQDVCGPILDLLTQIDAAL